MDLEALRQRVSLDAKTGNLLWLTRPLSDFPSAQSGRTCNARYAGRKAFSTVRADGYLRGDFTHKGRRFSPLAHHVVWALAHGEWPQGQVDHINGNRSDNRLCNLRLADSIGGNNKNRRAPKNNTSGIMGLRYHGGGWSIYVQRYRGREVCLGKAIAKLRKLRDECGFDRRHGQSV